MIGIYYRRCRYYQVMKICQDDIGDTALLTGEPLCSERVLTGADLTIQHRQVSDTATILHKQQRITIYIRHRY